MRKLIRLASFDTTRQLIKDSCRIGCSHLSNVLGFPHTSDNSHINRAKVAKLLNALMQYLETANWVVKEVHPWPDGGYESDETESSTSEEFTDPSSSWKPSDGSSQEPSQTSEQERRSQRTTQTAGGQMTGLSNRASKRKRCTENQAKKKKIVTHGPRPSVIPGGRGFECPSNECNQFFDTVEEAIKHGAEQCNVRFDTPYGREYDRNGKTRCLWDGCNRMLSASCMKRKKFTLGASFQNVRAHERLHISGHMTSSL